MPNMEAKFKLECSGGASQDKTVAKIRETVTFETKGNCTFIDFQFTPTDPPAGFSNKIWAADKSTVSYDYDGCAIPTTGYAFTYGTTDPRKDNGSGTIKNS